MEAEQAENYQKWIKDVKKLKSLVSRLKRVGITGMKVPCLIKLLKKHKIDVVFDVRQSYYYKATEGFKPTELKETLSKEGITYFYSSTLGNPFHRDFQAKFKSAQNNIELLKKINQEAKDTYLEYIKKEFDHKDQKDLFPQEKFKTLFKLVAHTKGLKSRTFCLLCYCKYPQDCHTYWLIEAIINKRREELGFDPQYILETRLYDKFSIKLEELSES